MNETTTTGLPETADYGQPTVTPYAEAERYDYYTSSLRVLLRAEQTGGQYFMLRSSGLKPADAPPFHRHSREDEVWIIHNGTFRFWIGGESLAEAKVTDVGPGDVVYGPRGVAHTFQSLGDDGECTILSSPGGSQSYFLNVAKTDEREDFDHLDSLTAIGVEVLDRAPVDGH